MQSSLILVSSCIVLLGRTAPDPGSCFLLAIDQCIADSFMDCSEVHRQVEVQRTEIVSELDAQRAHQGVSKAGLTRGLSCQMRTLGEDIILPLSTRLDSDARFLKVVSPILVVPLSEPGLDLSGWARTRKIFSCGACAVGSAVAYGEGV